MELKLNYFPNEEPIKEPDILWLKYMWTHSNDFNVVVSLENLPDYLVQTIIYSFPFKRFSYYRDAKHLLNFEYDEKLNIYYIALEKDFVSNLNSLIDECNSNSYITKEPIQHIYERGEGIVNNHISNNGVFNGPVNNQIGSENSNAQSPATSKKESLKFDFQGLVYAILQKIPLIKNFVKKD